MTDPAPEGNLRQQRDTAWAEAQRAWQENAELRYRLTLLHAPSAAMIDAGMAVKPHPVQGCGERKTLGERFVEMVRVAMGAVRGNAGG